MSVIPYLFFFSFICGRCISWYIRANCLCYSTLYGGIWCLTLWHLYFAIFTIRVALPKLSYYMEAEVSPVSLWRINNKRKQVALADKYQVICRWPMIFHHLPLNKGYKIQAFYVLFVIPQVVGCTWHTSGTYRKVNANWIWQKYWRCGVFAGAFWVLRDAPLIYCFTAQDTNAVHAASDAQPSWSACSDTRMPFPALLACSLLGHKIKWFSVGRVGVSGGFRHKEVLHLSVFILWSCWGVYRHVLVPISYQLRTFG